MSRLSRKAPPPIEDSIEQFKFDIEDYLSKSPITNKFREENPNLQPTVSNTNSNSNSNSSSVTNMVEPTETYNPVAYNSLDPSVTSTHKSIFSSGPQNQSQNHSHSSSYVGDNAEPDNGNHGSGSGPGSGPGHAHTDSNDSKDGMAYKTAPLEPLELEPLESEAENIPLKRTESRLSKFKRFSLNKLDLGNSKKFIPTHKKYNSINSPNSSGFNISSPVLNSDNTFVPNNNRGYNSKRNSLLSVKGSILTKRNSRSMNESQLKFSPSNQSLNSVDTNKTTSTSDTFTTELSEKTSTPYWKYHVLRFGKDLYVTTNPSVKHMYCRNGPGYYIEIIKNGGNGGETDDGFTMIFKDAETQSDKIRPPIMLIHKKAKKDGGNFTVSLTRSSQLKKKMIKYGNELNKEKRNIFNGLSMPQTIPEQYIPYDKVTNVKKFENNEANFKNYEVRDFHNLKWNVGSIPRVRTSKFNKFKSKLNDSHNNGGGAGDGGGGGGVADGEESDGGWKFIGRQNIYFHQNYIESNQIMPFKLNNPRDVYFQNPDNDNFPPVLCIFRPYKRNFSNRMKTSLNKRLSKNVSSWDHHHSNGDGNGNRISNKQLDYDIAGGEHKNYYIAGDGLYYDKEPVDDLPDENKLGWVTIYEDNILQEKGMFDLVLGLTLAVGYESHCGK